MTSNTQIRKINWGKSPDMLGCDCLLWEAMLESKTMRMVNGIWTRKLSNQTGWRNRWRLQRWFVTIVLCKVCPYRNVSKGYWEDSCMKNFGKWHERIVMYGFSHRKKWTYKLQYCLFKHQCSWIRLYTTEKSSPHLHSMIIFLR